MSNSLAGIPIFSPKLFSVHGISKLYLQRGLSHIPGDTNPDRTGLMSPASALAGGFCHLSRAGLHSTLRLRRHFVVKYMVAV